MTQKAVGNAYLIGPNYAAGNDMMAGAKSTFKGKVVGEDYTRWRHRVEPPRSGPIVDAGEGRGHVPGLAKRATTMARQLSGDEQQMLAIGRALMTNPRLLVLDEATEGLAPPIREEIWRCLTALKRAGQSIFVIDKNVDALIEIADRHYIIERGRIGWSATSRELAAAPDVQHRYLGI